MFEFPPSTVSCSPGLRCVCMWGCAFLLADLAAGGIACAMCACCGCSAMMVCLAWHHCACSTWTATRSLPVLSGRNRVATHHCTVVIVIFACVGIALRHAAACHLPWHATLGPPDHPATQLVPNVECCLSPGDMTRNCMLPPSGAHTRARLDPPGPSLVHIPQLFSCLLAHSSPTTDPPTATLGRW